MTPDLEDFPMQRLIDRLSAEFTRQAGHKGLAFQAESCRAIVRSDPNLLSEIIQNLVSNAIRYTEKGSVRLRCIEEDKRCCVEVEDTGIGIESDQLEAIFREFHQVRSPGGNKEGFGLGLAIVRRLADLLQHEIGVRSEPGKGSCFSLSVPIAGSGLAAGGPAEDRPAYKSGAGSGLIVLIEDDVNVANAWCLLLEAEGYRVATAASANEARALISHVEDVPAMIVSDYHLLDGSTGVEAVTEIRAYYGKNIPAFIVSGDTSKVMMNARSLDNCIVMSKPVNTNRLLAAAAEAARSGQVAE